MRAPTQTTLLVEPPLQQTLDNFSVGDNREIVAGLQTAVQTAAQNTGFVGLWLTGSASVGKSHLLRAACHLAHQADIETAFVVSTLAEMQLQDNLLRELELANHYGAVVAVDDADLLATHEAFESLFMSIYQRLVQMQGVLLVACRQPATGIEYLLPDLNSRMRSLLHYEVQQLDDERKAELLKSRALHKGYELDDAVLTYWLARGPRDVSALLTDLERLDQASLSRRRQVTVPLLKDELGY